MDRERRRGEHRAERRQHASAATMPRITERGARRHPPGQLPPGREPARRAEPAGKQRDAESGRDRLPERRRRQRGPARHRDRTGEQRVGEARSTSAASPTSRSRCTWPSWVIQRPARSISAAGSSTRPSGSSPIRPTPWTVTSTWCATSQSSPAERSTPASPPPRPTCGAVIQPIRVSVTSTASPPPAAASAADPARHEHRSARQRRQIAHIAHPCNGSGKRHAATPRSVRARWQGRHRIGAHTAVSPGLPALWHRGPAPDHPRPVPPDVGTPTTLVATSGTEYHIDNT